MTGSVATQALPHWDMTSIFPSLQSPEFAEGFQAVIDKINAMSDLFDKYQVARREPAPLDDETTRAVEDVIGHYNAVSEAVSTLTAYIHCFVTTNSRDNLAQARLSELQGHTVKLSQLGTRFTAWIGSLDVEELIDRSEIARAHAFALRQAKVRATHLMSPPEELLAAELNLSGGAPWAKLHTNITSQLSVPLEVDGKTQELPMSMVRNLAYEADREVRRKAYEAELKAWEKAAVPLAGALNSIKGQVNTLSKRRGWESALDASLFDSNIDRETLDAMMQAARESFPDFRRYFKTKARALGLDALTWYDIFAPVGEGSKVWQYSDAEDFIIKQFGTFSQSMSDMAARAFHENWIDAEPRSGKRDGAFCILLRGAELRVLANYKAAYGGVRTLAHELGHAYHNVQRAPRTAMQRSTPMTLAETAEHILRNDRQARSPQGSRPRGEPVYYRGVAARCRAASS